MTSTLAEWVNINHPHKTHQKASECSSLGRNCYLFDKLRKWSYQAVRRHRGGDYKTWHAEVLSKAHEYNEFVVPMIDSEIKAISKSISKWVWQKDIEAEIKFRSRQSEKGRRGGFSSGKIRLLKNLNKKVVAQILRSQGLSYAAISREIDMSQVTIKRWLK